MFKNNNARNLFIGRVISTSGDSLYRIAVIWYVFEISHNAFYTGLAAAIVMVPNVLNFIFGPIIEQLNKKIVLVYAQFLQFLLLLIVPICILIGYESVVIVITVMFFVSFLENFQGTAEVAMVPKIIEKDSLGKFNSYITSAQQLVDIGMKSVFAGFILFIGIENIYFYNSFTFLLAALFFSMIKLNKTNIVSEKSNFSWIDYKESLKTGFVYFFTTKIFLLCLPFLIVNFVFGMTEAILPVYANQRGDTGLYGYFILAITIGNLIGSFFAMKLMKYPLGKLMIFLPFMTFLIWISSIFISNNLISMIILGAAFIPFGMMNIIFITFLQTSVEEDMIARVSSIIDSVLVSALPIGALSGGFFTPLLGVEVMMVMSCLGLLGVSIFFIVNKNIRSLPKISEIQI